MCMHLVDNWRFSWLLYYFDATILMRPNQVKAHSCPRLKFLTFSLDSIMFLTRYVYYRVTSPAERPR